jgi:hypothetical protein
MRSEKENKNKENTQISLNPRMSHTCAAVGQTKTAQFAETDILTTLPLVAIGLRPCAHRHRVSSSRSHNSITRNNNNPCMPRTTKHQQKQSTNSCSCSAQTHKIKVLKPCRELHSLQVNDLIVKLRTSASRQQLPLAQQHHAQQQQPLHAPHHKTSKRKQIKQLQLQRANSQDKVAEDLKGTALLAG